VEASAVADARCPAHRFALDTRGRCPAHQWFDDILCTPELRKGWAANQWDAAAEYYRLRERRAEREGLSIGEFLNVPEGEAFADPLESMVIPGLLAPSERLFLTGAEGAGKSTFLRQVAMRVGAGLHPFIDEEIELGGRGVLLVDLENNERDIVRSFNTICAADPRCGVGDLTIITKPEGARFNTDEDRSWLMEHVENTEPALVLIGPAYKAVTGSLVDEATAMQLLRVVDDVRTSPGRPAFIGEFHQTHANDRGYRSKRPFGASALMRAPEFGLHLSSAGTISRWRDDRTPRDWPQLRRGDAGELPWMVGRSGRSGTWDCIVEAVRDRGAVPSYQALADALGVSKSTIARCVTEHQSDYDALVEEYGR
jgi:replicative DNA helicase